MSTCQPSRPTQVPYRLNNGIDLNGERHTLTKVKFDMKDAQHIQGMGAYDNFIILSYSCEEEVSTPGHLLVFDKTSGEMLTSQSITLPEGQRHPAGMQSIGDYLMVAIDVNTGQNVVALYNLAPLKSGQAPTLQASLKTDKSVRCAGITDITENGETRFVLVVPEHEGEQQQSHFYKSTFSDLASLRDGNLDDGTQFVDCGWHKVDSSENCGLVTRQDGRIFFVGFRSDGSDLLSYTDYIETWEVKSLTPTVELKKVESRHVYSSDGGGHGIHFRWGACLEISSDQRLTCYATERNQSDGKIKYDAFNPQEILWADVHQYTTGQEPFIALDEAGHFVEVHRGYSASHDNQLYYGVGQVDFNTGTLTFKKDQDGNLFHSYTTGQTPCIALDNAGRLVEVHRGYSASHDNQLYYGVGQVDFNTGTLAFKKDTDGDPFHPYTTGQEPSIGLDNAGRLVEVHRGYSASHDNQLYYGVGQVDFNAGTLTFQEDKDDDKFHSYTTGQTPCIALDNAGHLIEVHRGYSSSHEDQLYYGVGQVDFNAGTLAFREDKDDDKFHSYTTGQEPSIGLDNAGRLVEVHRGYSSSHEDQLYYGVGQVNFSAGTLTFQEDKDGSEFHPYTIELSLVDQTIQGRTPAIALDDSNHCIEVHFGSNTSTGNQGLYEVTGTVLS